jgi:hypothetical protein
MATISVRFNEINGVIKPMHAVNNGPVRQYKVDTGRDDNFETYRAARIPYARTHDASFYSLYGGEHTVDIQAIFPNFNANPYDPSSYDFCLTDEYLQNIKDAGTEIFYRLGTKIEHWRKKYGTIVPADFHKWAVICEHIIRHYNEGWANGFHHNIIYWEIWNEPDGVKANGDQPNWSGTPQQFYDLYIEAATHLKRCFPDIKVGGPGVSSLRRLEWTEGFLSALTSNGRRVPLDFFSWHYYGIEVEKNVSRAKIARELLDRYGYTETESILNEWNYVEGWSDLWTSSILAMIGMRGAAYCAANMLGCQNSGLDMLMYYDARPCTMNGMFDYYTFRPLKGYYPFYMYSELYELKNSCKCNVDDENIYCVAASNENASAVMVVHYSPEKNVPEKTVAMHFEDEDANGEWQVYFLDETRTMEESHVTVQNGKAFFTMPENSVMLIKKVDP